MYQVSSSQKAQVQVKSRVIGVKVKVELHVIIFVTRVHTSVGFYQYPFSSEEPFFDDSLGGKKDSLEGKCYTSE